MILRRSCNWVRPVHSTSRMRKPVLLLTRGMKHPSIALPEVSGRRNFPPQLSSDGGAERTRKR